MLIDSVGASPFVPPSRPAGSNHRHDLHPRGPHSAEAGGAGLQVRQHGDGGKRSDLGGRDVHPDDATGEGEGGDPILICVVRWKLVDRRNVVGAVRVDSREGRGSG